MLDPKILRDTPEKVQKMLKDRAVDFDLNKLIEADKKRREFIIKTDELRQKKNQVALEISKKKKMQEAQMQLNLSSEEKPEKKIARNDPCPCGSGKKYKQCCGKSGPKKGVFAS